MVAAFNEKAWSCLSQNTTFKHTFQDKHNLYHIWRAKENICILLLEEMVAAFYQKSKQLIAFSQMPCHLLSLSDNLARQRKNDSLRSGSCTNEKLQYNIIDTLLAHTRFPSSYVCSREQAK